MARSAMVNSVLKALDILRLAADAPDGMRLNEIADALGMKKTTAHNLIRTLRARGFLEKDAANRFFPGRALGELVRMRGRNALFSAVGRRMREWQRLFPEATLSFSELTPGAIHCRLRMSPDRPGELQKPEDRFFPPYASATAVCLQATANNAAVFERGFPFAEHGRGVWTDADAWLAEKRRVRQEGRAERNGPDGRYAVAYALPENYALGFSVERPSPDFPEAARRAVESLLGSLADEAKPRGEPEESIDDGGSRSVR